MSSETKAAATPGGTIEVEGRLLTVQKLTVSGELALLSALRAGAKRSFGPGGYFQRARASLDWLRDQKMHAEHAQAVAEIARLEATGAGASDDATDEFARTPDGLAVELFWRTRKTHPEVTEREFRAGLSDANALDVYLSLRAAVSDAGKAATPGS